MKQSQDYNPLQSEVTIIGAGLNGAIAGIMLSSLGFKVSMVDRVDIYKASKQKEERAFAITSFCSEVLSKYGLWDGIAEQAGKIKEIKIIDSDHPSFLIFTREDYYQEAMGYMVPARLLKEHIRQQLVADENINFIQDEVEELGEDGVVTLKSGQVIESELVIVADGRKSRCRELLGIPSISKDYNQTAIVANIHHQKSHHQIAYEKFFAEGPFAMLPLLDSHESSIVWTEHSHLAPLYLAMGEEELMYHLARKFGDFLGSLKLASEVVSYPLGLNYCKTSVKGKNVLVGDAWHAIHPIAGQGFNLGVRDVECLVNLLAESRGAGLELADYQQLENYQQQRKWDNYAMIQATDKLDGIFRVKNPLIAGPRKLGLAAINKIPALKHLLVKYAMGYR